MAISLPGHARVVIVGGGVIGCSLAYHLTKAGCTDVVLLERKQLTCGTTWHAAGLIGQLRATSNMTRLAQYTAQLYAGLEAETGQATGWRQVGSLSVATDRERLEEITRNADMARCFGLEVEIVGPDEAKRLWPMLETKDVIGAVWLPNDGKINPIDVTQAMAKGARTRGARIVEHVKATGIVTKGGRAAGVVTDHGTIAAEVVVNCGGMWAREIGRMAGVNVPLHACEHFYCVTEPIPGLDPNAPVLRDRGQCLYFKEDAGKLLVGFFEPNGKPWGMEGIPEDFAFGTLPEDVDHVMPLLEAAMRRVPVLEKTGLQLFFNGPESFTPDDRYLLGEAPELPGFFVAAGFNSVGVQSGGGAGKVLAEWILEGRPPMDLWDVDIRRMMPFQGTRHYLRERVTEGLGLLYAMHWPFRQFESARPVRVSPLHERLKARGACFGEAAGWERPNWFAPPGIEPRYEYSWGRQNWFPYSAAEHKAVREAAGLFDETSFSKFVFEGADAEKILDRVCANRVAVEPGRIVYTQWLNERGTIEADVTVTRLAETRFLIVTSSACQVRDFAWLKRQIPADGRAVLIDVTSAYSVIGLMGPKSRALLQSVTDSDISNAAFPFGTSREIEIGYALVRAARITYVGELGWELYVPTEFVAGVYDRLVTAGERVGLVHAGYHAINSLRIEKAYRHFGHDISIDETPLEAGLGFCVAWDKPGGFIGRDELLRQRERGVKKRLVQFALRDPEPMLYHNEPIWRDGKLVGYLTSGMYGHTLGCAIGLGYVKDPDGGLVPPEFVRAGAYELQVAGKRIPATASLKPMYDPDGERVRG